ncbi:MAG TPA: ATP-binding protein [Coriobacteriia bacterium]
MTDSGHVALRVPARGEFARTARLVAAELATRAGMCIDDVDDVRLAVEEAFVYACERSASGWVDCAFTLAEGSVELLLGPLPPGCDDPDTGEAGERYARFILEAICDEFEIIENAEGCFLRLVKRAA